MSVHRIFGSELSPYSVKVRSYFRYKRIPHQWVLRTVQNQAEFERHAKLPLIPLVIAPDGPAMQDSTPIIERMEALFPEPSIHPSELGRQHDPARRPPDSALPSRLSLWPQPYMSELSRKLTPRSSA